MFNLNNMDSIFTRNKAVPVFYTYMYVFRIFHNYVYHNLSACIIIILLQYLNHSLCRQSQ